MASEARNPCTKAGFLTSFGQFVYKDLVPKTLNTATGTLCFMDQAFCDKPLCCQPLILANILSSIESCIQDFSHEAIDNSNFQKEGLDLHQLVCPVFNIASLITEVLCHVRISVHFRLRDRQEIVSFRMKYLVLQHDIVASDSKLSVGRIHDTLLAS